MKVSILTKGGSRPSGIDADGWRRILTSHDFGTAQLDLGKTFTQLIKRFCVEEPESASYLESFVACRLTPLDKKPEIRAHFTGALQLSVGQDTRIEAVAHAMYDIFSEESNEALLLIDAENAINSINRKVMLHNM